MRYDVINDLESLQTIEIVIFKIESIRNLMVGQ